MKLVECVPNFSEGRDKSVIDAIKAAIASVDGVAVLDVSSDMSHNRTVITFVAPLDSAVDAALAGMKEAAARIDLTKHKGEHPRIGATDVVPFVPLESSTMEDCVLLARALGERAATELGIPVYLYERAASRPDRVNLADVRRGEFEGLREEITTNAARKPDFGDARVHPTAGATAVGARPFLVAFNVYLGPAANLPVAREVAQAVRFSTGGLRHVKALALEVDGQAQVSMNLVDLDGTPLHRVFEMVRMEAAAYGVTPTWSEIVGLVPERALYEAAARHIQLRGFTPEMVLDRRVRLAIAGGDTVTTFAAAVASPVPAPGGGAVVAHVGALGAALAQMVAGLTVGRKKYAAVDADMRELALKAAGLVVDLQRLADRDIRAYESVTRAFKLPKDTDAQAQLRADAVDAALVHAAQVPLETARACARVAEFAATAAERGNTNASSDAGVAALLAEAACRGAVYNVRINISSMTDKSRGRELLADAEKVLHDAGKFAELATAAVERHISN